MFRSARVKLTGWYLLIIMLISMVFSAVIYTSTTRELERGFRRAEMRFRGEELDTPCPRQRPEHLRFSFTEDIEAAKKRVVLNLLMINGAILAFSSAAGYFLAGKTLRPIEATMEEQKRFVADASHELRTPLTALKTSIEVALRKKRLVDKDSRAIMESSLEDIDGLESLANNLLSLTQYS